MRWLFNSPGWGTKFIPNYEAILNLLNIMKSVDNLSATKTDMQLIDIRLKKG